MKFTANFLQLRANPPKELIHWLTCPDSLTEKLASSLGNATLIVQNECWRNTNWWEKYNLSYLQQKVFCREIIMYSQKTPCWYARTIIPQETYEKNYNFFKRLENESLGVIIFNTNGIRRELITYYPLDKRCIEFYWFGKEIKADVDTFWARFSIFSIEEKYQFYLVEIMLPGLLRNLA